MRKVILGLALLVVGFPILLRAQTVTYTSSMVGVNAGNKNATFTFTNTSTDNSNTLLVIQPEFNPVRGILITHSGVYAKQQSAFLEPLTMSLANNNGIFSAALTGTPPFEGTVTLQTEPLPAYPTQPAPPSTVTVTINSANWTYHCAYRQGCTAQGTASISVTGSF